MYRQDALRSLHRRKRSTTTALAVLICAVAGCLRTPPPAGPGLPPEDAAVHIRLNQPRSLDLRTASGEVIQVTAAEILIGRLRPSRSPDSVRIFVSEVRQPFGDRRRLPLGTMAVLPRDSSIKMTVITANRPAMRQGVATVLGFVAGAVIAIALLLRGN